MSASPPSGASRALILSGSIGSGHDAVARACAEALEGAGWASSTLDALELLGGWSARLARTVFRHALDHPPLYDALHFSALRADSALARRAAARSTARLLRALEDELADPSLGLVCAVFATRAGAVGAAARRGLPGIVVLTDATAHGVWVQPGVTRYVVFHELAAATVRQYDAGAEVAVVDAPVRAAFLDAPEKSAARAALGLPPDVGVALVMGGGWGRGPLEEIARHLAADGWLAVVLAGSNRSLLRGRDTFRGAHPPVFLPVSDRVSELMAAADVVVTPPGQACHEARAVGRPLVVIDSVPGHGRENLLAELGRGDALACLPRGAAVAACVGVAAKRRVAPSGGGFATGFLHAVGLETSPRRDPEAELRGPSAHPQAPTATGRPPNGAPVGG